jgi:hypothetical protein
MRGVDEVVGTIGGGLTRRRLLNAVAALTALVVVGLLGGCGGGGSASSNNPTAAELYAKQIQVGTFGTYVAGEDPDELDRGGVDVTTVIRSLGGDRYQLLIQNASDVGFINTFSWYVNGDAGLAGKTNAVKLLSVGTSTAGHCKLAIDKNSIICTGMTIRPPSCTCLPGGTVTVNFTAVPNYKWLRSLPQGPKAKLATHYGIFQNSMTVLGDMTPVPYHIPSYREPDQSLFDLPLCAKGEPNTTAHPCVHGS